MSDIKLPPLPLYSSVLGMTVQEVQDYARQCVLADRAERAEPEYVFESALCESRSLVLHIGRLYRFTPIDGCKSCEAMQIEHDEAYGPAAPSQERGADDEDG